MRIWTLATISWALIAVCPESTLSLGQGTRASTHTQNVGRIAPLTQARGAEYSHTKCGRKLQAVYQLWNHNCQQLPYPSNQPPSCIYQVCSLLPRLHLSCSIQKQRREKGGWEILSCAVTSCKSGGAGPNHQTLHSSAIVVIVRSCQ